MLIYTSAGQSDGGVGGTDPVLGFDFAADQFDFSAVASGDTVYGDDGDTLTADLDNDSVVDVRIDVAGLADYLD